MLREPVSREWLGRVAYREALVRQRERREQILAGTAAEALWLLEHDPVVTVGRRVASGLDPERIALDGADLVHTERGGLATWHGPGQLVGYLLVDVGGRGGSVRATVRGIEEGLITWLAGRRTAAGRRDGYPGVWVEDEKIAAIGLHFRRGVSMHGFALNLQVDPAVYRGFVPCGIADHGVTSLSKHDRGAPSPSEAADAVGGAVLAALGWGR